MAAVERFTYAGDSAIVAFFMPASANVGAGVDRLGASMRSLLAVDPGGVPYDGVYELPGGAAPAPGGAEDATYVRTTRIGRLIGPEG